MRRIRSNFTPSPTKTFLLPVFIEPFSNTWFNNNGYIGKCGYPHFACSSARHSRASSMPSQFNRSSWAVPELYELIQGVPLSERGWKNSPVPTAGTNPSARPPHQSKVSLIHLIPLTISTSKTKPPRALLPLGASEAYRCATRAPEHTAPENGDTFLIEKNGRIEETAGVRGDSHGQAARRTSLFPHSSRTD